MKGYDWHKRVKGRKRHLLVDTHGWLLTAQVTGANRFDTQQLQALVQAARQHATRLNHVWVDGGYRDRLTMLRLQHQYGITVEVVSKPKTAKGWHLLPRRWVVERTFAWLGRFRRMSKDYAFLVATSEAMIYSILSSLMLRQLALL